LAVRLVEGAEVVGTVKNLAEYGVFVDLGGIDGLLHIIDLAWGRVANAAEVVQVGQEIRVKVLKHDVEKGRISLGLKQLTPDPWEMVPQTYHAGEHFKVAWVSLADYGAFVTSARNRGPHPHFRNELEQTPSPSFQDSQPGRYRRGRGSGSRYGQAPNLPEPEGSLPDRGAPSAKSMPWAQSPQGRCAILRISAPLWKSKTAWMG